jgi:TldD protein
MNTFQEKDKILSNKFYNKIDLISTTKQTQNSLLNFDLGELFVESKEMEQITLEDGVVTSILNNSLEGFGLRAVKETQTVYLHNNILTDKELTTSFNKLKNTTTNFFSPSNDANTIINQTKSNTLTNNNIYSYQNPISEMNLKTKIDFLTKLYNFTKQQDISISKVKISLYSDYQVVLIINNEGCLSTDIRPLTKFSVQIFTKKNQNQEIGSDSFGGRDSILNTITEENCKQSILSALKMSLDSHLAKECFAGNMPVILSNGWTGVLIHEAIGHGLESDFIRKKTSVFNDKLGTKIASNNITIVDSGIIKNSRGSINIDDEGTNSQSTTLIENGILVNYMYDTHNAKLLNKKSTGNGRRESFKSPPLPRMTNTYMLNGNSTEEEMISSVKKGIFAKSFYGGQVDITSGQFVFSCMGCYEIENGKLTNPLKGATIIGQGEKALLNISMVGNNSELDKGVGLCGKNGQNLPVCVGQPSVKIDSILVGGTKI